MAAPTHHGRRRAAQPGRRWDGRLTTPGIQSPQSAAGVHVDHRPPWWTWSTGCQRRARCTVRCSVAEYESRKPSAPVRTGHLCCCCGFRSASRHLAARVGERLVDDLLVTGTHIYRLGGYPVAVMARIRTGVVAADPGGVRAPAPVSRASVWGRGAGEVEDSTDPRMVRFEHSLRPCGRL